MITSFKQYKNETRKKKILIASFQCFLFISFIFLWEILTKVGFLNSFLISSPSRIINLFKEMTASNSLFPHIYISTKEMLISLFFSTIVGIIIASILYLIPSLFKIIDPYLVVLNAIPKTALGPILIIYLGTGEKGIIGVSITFSIIITIISSLTTFKSVDKDLIKLMKVYKASSLSTLFKVIYPASLNGLLSILKVNIGLSWVGVIVGEYLVSRSGIGYLIMYGGQIFKLDLVMLGIIVLSLITLIFNLTINIINRLIKKIVRI